MHLKELRVNGFKSFADPTRLNFDRGVTAIVGPNGCGKSNIADAIRWVLGEQSAKALRGGKMQDVIFEGTDQRKPLPICEVSLLFTDCEKELGEGFHEVEITRRVTRDGGGEYALNGKSCRLKDIQRIFMDTGIGRTSYSIMAQGQIDQILSTNPTERRAIFEEAAGITKYKAQRREALNKLKLVETNLTRLTDVINEVKRQIGSLRRQASKAVRYKRLRYRLEKLDLAWGAWQFAGLRVEINDLTYQARRLEETAAATRATLAAVEEKIDAARTERTALSERLQQAQQAVFDLRSEKEQALNKAQLATARQGDLRFRIEETGHEIEALTKQLDELESIFAGTSRQKEEQSAVFRDSDEAFQAKNRELQDSRQKLETQEQLIARQKQTVLTWENEVTRQKSRLSALEIEFKSDEKRLESVAANDEPLQAEEASGRERLTATVAAREAAAAEQAEREKALQVAQEQRATAREKVLTRQKECQQLDRENAQLATRLRTLEQLRERFEGFGEGAKALLQGKCTAELGEVSFQPLTRNLKIKKGYAPFLEQLLGPALEMVAAGDLATARQAVSVLAERQLGRACLQFTPPGPTAEAVAPAGIPEGLTPAMAFFQTLPKGREAALRIILEGCYLVDSLDQWLTCWEAHPDFTFRLIVTRQGELLDARGLLFGGAQKGQGNAILQREAEIQEAEARLQEGQEKLAARQKTLAADQSALEALEAALEKDRQEALQAAQRRGSLQAEEKAAQRALDEASHRLRRHEQEKNSLHERLSRAREKLDEVQEAVTRATTNWEKARAEATGIEDGLEALRKEVEERQNALNEVRFDLAEKRQRLELIDRGLSDAAQRRERTRLQLEQKRRDAENFSRQESELSTQIERQQEVARKMDGEMQAATNRVDEVRKAFTALEDHLRQLDKEVHEARSQWDETNGKLNRIQVRLAELNSRTEYLLEESRREYDADLAEIDWPVVLWEADEEPPGKHPLDLDEDDGEDDLPATSHRPRPSFSEEERKELAGQTDWSVVGEEVKKIRARLQSMGPVNLVAIEEYAELKERFEFLQSQSDDLTESREQLVTAIDEINHRSQSQFAMIFEQIRKNFAYTFDKLFGGGKADLLLLESEDPLESGVDIIAQPPGTRLNTLVLLSGGQKTMTAVSLLFAIYMVKPSPFCVLDELDAPLDEANIGRFTGMLREFTSHSQFLIITHNKRTISEASAIFGVTMEEKGVSKVVSMRFNREGREPEVQPIA